MPDRVIIAWSDGTAAGFVLPAGVTIEAAAAAAEILGASVRRIDAQGAKMSPGTGAAGFARFRASLTPAEKRVLTELAHRPDTRSRLAVRLDVTTSTLDNQLAAIKRKLLDELESAGQSPKDGYLSMEALIGWAHRNFGEQKS